MSRMAKMMEEDDDNEDLRHQRPSAAREHGTKPIVRRKHRRKREAQALRCTGMTDALSNVLQMTAAAASAILMGVCGVYLCVQTDPRDARAGKRVGPGERNGSNPAAGRTGHGAGRGGGCVEPPGCSMRWRMAFTGAGGGANVLCRIPLRRFGRTGMRAIIWALRRTAIPASATSGFGWCFFRCIPRLTRRVFSRSRAEICSRRERLVSLLCSAAARGAALRFGGRCILDGRGRAAGGCVFPAQPDERVSCAAYIRKRCSSA